VGSGEPPPPPATEEDPGAARRLWEERYKPAAALQKPDAPPSVASPAAAPVAPVSPAAPVSPLTMPLPRLKGAIVPPEELARYEAELAAHKARRAAQRTALPSPSSVSTATPEHKTPTATPGGWVARLFGRVAE